MSKPRSFAPIIAVVLLLLPVLYVGSYLALVVPGEAIGSLLVETPGPPRITYMISPTDTSIIWENYRCGDRIGKILYWPLEQIDRRVRHDQWDYGDPLPLSLPPMNPILAEHDPCESLETTTPSSLHSPAP